MLRKMIIVISVLVFSLFAVPSFAHDNTTYQLTKQQCTKKQADKVKNNRICLKHNKKYKWHKIINNTIHPISQSNKPVVTLGLTEETNKAYSNVIEGFKKYHSNDIQLNVISSPLVNKDLVSRFVNQYKKALSPYGKLIDKHINLVFFNELESNWWKEQVLLIEKRNSFPSGVYCLTNPNVLCPYGSNDVLNPVFYHMVGSSVTWNDNYATLVDHESVHAFQVATWKSVHKTCWSNEGYATFLQLSQSSLHDKNVSKIRSGLITDIEKFFPNYRNFTESDWNNNIKSMFNIVSEPCRQTHIGYSLGMLFFEYMYLTYDFELVQKLISDVHNNNHDFDIAIKNNFNITKDTFIENLSKYLTKVAK